MQCTLDREDKLATWSALGLKGAELALAEALEKLQPGLGVDELAIAARRSAESVKEFMKYRGLFAGRRRQIRVTR